ncbi:P27 family phage terminase small subunit [Microbacterium immunditiarum]|uniref:Phage terminase small subunit n=1 Tax=Microbacterium immunditiarum TaxID=337480 RepID=A0A7Y9GQ31_9MICO|nr:P27 family phage terminase small subunit [Microbacterium immunditiarum]NYE19460.1 phage terminase small subunit [Microbacterium immunditiarum]
MTEGKAPTPPRGLGKRGRAFWRQLHADYEFEVAQTEVLIEACRTLDRLEALDAVIADEGVTSEGSMGQRIVHPAVQEARQLQITLTRLVAALELPPSDEDVRAHERWKTQRAKAGAAARGLRAVN